MSKYFINKTCDENGKNEVHKSSCAWFKIVKNYAELGEFNDGIAAVDYAKANGYPNADGCKHCCPEAHTA